MKTILDKIPLQIEAGETVTLTLPEPFRLQDSLFLLVHNALNETLKVTLTNATGHSLSQNVTLDSFPTIIVFSECEDKENHFLNTLAYFSVSFTSFQAFEGSLTFRVKNPLHLIAAYRNQ